jgi:D-beta-D-heptose 7-phosphate kinase/D-beta-D-heptose 1-phosphate adenosyltransferase
MSDLSLNFLDRISILVVGDVMMDRYLWGDIRRISPEAPVPVVEIESETHTAGGAANVAHNLAALGVRCELFGLVCNDANGAELAALLKQQNVAFDPRLARASAPTITKTRIIAQRQQVCRLDREADPASYSLEQAGLLGLLAEKAAQYDAVIMSDYAKGVVTQAVVDTLRDVQAKRRSFLALDPKPLRPLEVSGLDLITPNYSEALGLSGIVSHGRQPVPPEEIATAVLERYRPKCLVITLGAKGMLLCAPGAPARLFPTQVRQVADVSGAGDTVISTLTAAIAGGLSPENAVTIANAAAGVVVGKLGTATATRAEIKQALTAGRTNTSESRNDVGAPV